MKNFNFFTALVLLFSLSAFSQEPTLVITEIMYNPGGSDGGWEWMEIYNSSSETINLAGYVLDDGSGPDLEASNISEGMLLPQQSAILFSANTTSEQFRDVWGRVDLIPVSNWPTLGNGESGDSIGIWSDFESYEGDHVNQINTIEQLSYKSDAENWPADEDNGSIYLIDLELDNTNGSSWSLSRLGIESPLNLTYTSIELHGNSGADIGSPGIPDLISDNEPPVITCRDDIMMSSAEDSCGVSFPIELPTATDNISTVFTFQSRRDDSKEITDEFPVGTTTIIWTAIDEAGNVSESCEQQITVNDDVKPEIICSADISVIVDGSMVFEIEPAAATENCTETIALTFERSDDSSLTLADPFPQGVTMIEWKAVDDSGNEAICIQTVTITTSSQSMVNDITAFEIQDQAQPAEIDLVEKTIKIEMPFGTDLSALIPIIRVSPEAAINPSSEEPQDFTTIIIYTVTAEDGTEQEWTVLIEIEADQVLPTIECPERIIVDNDAGECGAIVEFDILYSDDRPDAVLEVSIDSGSFFEVGTTEITTTVTDTSGNIVTCSFEVTVNDTELPVLSCKDATVQLNASGEVFVTVTDVYDSISDNCIIETVSISPASFTESDLGENEVTLTVSDVNGNTNTCTVMVNVLPFENSVLAIVSFTLIDADTDEPLLDLVEGQIIEIDDLPTRHLDIRANTTEEVESVRISLSGALANERTESRIPFALYRDLPIGDYIGEDFVLGQYMVSATPYSEDALGGEMGALLTLNFQLVDSTNELTVTNFILVDADTEEDLFAIIDGMQIDMATLPTMNLDIRAEVGGEVESVGFQLSGSQSITRGESLPPYALFQDLPIGDYIGHDFDLGEYVLTGTPYTKNRLGGDAGEVLTIGFEFIDSIPTLAIIGFTLIDAATDEAHFDLAEGMKITLEEVGSLFLDIRANTTDDVESVRLELSGEQSTARTESLIPYALFRDLPIGDYIGNNFDYGIYTVTATPYSGNKLSGEIGMPLSMTFEIVDEVPSNKLSIVPNQASTFTMATLKRPAEVSQILIFDMSGRLLESVDPRKAKDGDGYVLDVSFYQQGTYIVKIIDVNGVPFQRQMVVKRQ